MVTFWAAGSCFLWTQTTTWLFTVYLCTLRLVTQWCGDFFPLVTVCCCCCDLIHFVRICSIRIYNIQTVELNKYDSRQCGKQNTLTFQKIIFNFSDWLAFSLSSLSFTDYITWPQLSHYQPKEPSLSLCVPVFCRCRSEVDEINQKYTTGRV